MRLRISSVLLPVFVLTACFLTGAAAGAEGQEKLTIRPLPVRWILADADRPCGPLLGVEEERYGKKASEVLASANAESSDGVAYQLVKAAARKDSASVRSFMLNPDGKQLKGFDLAKYLAYCDIPEDPILMRIYRLGKASLYVFVGRRPPVWAILITPDQGKYFWDLPGQNDDPLCSMVFYINRAIAADPSNFGPVKDLDGYQSIELPPVFGDTDREHPARLYFKGIRYVAKVHPLTEEAIKQLPTTNNPSVDEAVKFYARAWQKLAAGDTAAFADMLSRNDSDYVRTADKDKVMLFFVGKYHPYRQLDYIIYSDKAFWMFYQLSKGPYTEKWLNYHIVIWDDATKGYKLVRIYPFLDPLNSFTHWHGLSKEMIDKCINAGQDAHLMTEDHRKAQQRQKGGQN